ncbi:hypothetical protein F8388_002775 [Cannabis sativa]|uniref:Uncharacterized protein n=1 Tax=Cannabis sativa TaxID=3483 RepID=A0A7J6EFQ8_CANSA|nr:hypothetical protein F8388_002775 [Cannabis sativa]
MIIRKSSKVVAGRDRASVIGCRELVRFNFEEVLHKDFVVSLDFVWSLPTHCFGHILPSVDKGSGRNVT